MNLDKRLPFVDIAKGIGIICIVAGHIFPISMGNQWLYAFHVPLFFIISGFTYSPSGDFGIFLRRKFTRLMIPYYFFSVVSILVMLVMAQIISINADTKLIPNLLGMLYANSNSIYMEWNRPLWFLPCLFVSLIIVELFEALLVHMDARRGSGCRILFIAISWCVGMLVNTKMDVYLPLHLESALFLVGFIEFGFLMRMLCEGGFREKQAVSVALGIKVVTLIALPAIGVAASNFNGWTDISTHTFGNAPWALIISSLSFSLAVLIGSGLLGKCGWLEYLGKHSVSILVMHKFSILFFRELIPGVSELVADVADFRGIACGLAITAVSIALCLLAEKILMWIVPAAVGAKRKKIVKS